MLDMVKREIYLDVAASSGARISRVANPRNFDLGFTGDTPCMFPRVRVRRTCHTYYWKVHSQQATGGARDVAATQ